MNSARPRRERGMTVMEVIVATMILAVAAIVVFSAFAIGLRAAAMAGNMHTATSLAEETLAVLTASPCGSSFEAAVPAEHEDPRFRRYRREVEVRRLADPGLWDISTTVSWVQERMRRSVTLRTQRHVSLACSFGER